MQRRTPQQNVQLHALLNKAGLMADKRRLVWHATDGRANSSAAMTRSECALLIDKLSNIALSIRLLGEAQRRKMLGLCYDRKWITLHGSADKEKLNAWIRRYGTVKKAFQTMSPHEWQRAVSQLEAMRSKISPFVTP